MVILSKKFFIIPIASEMDPFQDSSSDFVGKISVHFPGFLFFPVFTWRLTGHPVKDQTGTVAAGIVGWICFCNVFHRENAQNSDFFLAHDLIFFKKMLLCGKMDFLRNAKKKNVILFRIIFLIFF